MPAWLIHAAENELATERGLDAVREWEADHGALTGDEIAVADTLLDRVVDASRRGPQAEVSRLLKGCRVEVLDEMRRPAAGHACGGAHTSDVVDGTVTVGSVARGDLVLTSDTDDIKPVASARGASLETFSV